MQTPPVIRSLRPMREVHPVRNAAVLALLAVILIACAIVWWDDRPAAEAIARAVSAWQ